MRNGMRAIAWFSVGAFAGYIMTKKALERKYVQISKNEIDSVKQRFKKMLEDSPTSRNNGKENHQKELDGGSSQEIEGIPSSLLTSEGRNNDESIKDYVHYASMFGYTNHNASETGLKPRVITPDEYGEMSEYDHVSLVYYADDVLATCDGRALHRDEIEEMIGIENLYRLGEHEAGSLFVRNDQLKIEYEILEDIDTYSSNI